jgi:hypothetical protein
MELTCSRCHQTVQDVYCFCPNCGLPQLVYSAETSADAAQRERWGETVRDAGAVDWNSALRSTFPLAIPAGILCSTLSPVGILGVFLMGATAAWVVALYVRSHRSTWITIGAGARIGLVCGILGGALAFAASSCALYTERYVLHQGSQIDADWKKFVDLDMQVSQRFAGWIGAPDSAQILAQETEQQNWMLSPDGHASIVVANFAFASVLLVLFAIAGGALSARRLTRTRRPEN